jgi:hypothetical protein
MASTYVKLKSLSSVNIVNQLNGLSFTGLTPGIVQPLSLLSEHRKFDPDDSLLAVDKVFTPYFLSISVHIAVFPCKLSWVYRDVQNYL